MFSIFIFIGRPHSYSTMTDNFDVYNIETALPKIDLEAIENHLKAAKEEERRVSSINIFFIIWDSVCYWSNKIYNYSGGTFVIICNICIVYLQIFFYF